MISGYCFMLLSVMSSLAVAQVLRWVKQKEKSVVGAITVNYAVATLIALYFADFTTITWSVVILSAITGLLYIGNFYVFAASLKLNGMGLSVFAMRLSVIIPILGSIFVFNEGFTVSLWIGVTLFGLAVYLLKKNSTSEMKSKEWLVILLLLFLMSGISDFSSKIYLQIKQDSNNPYTFMSLVFATALITGLVTLIINQEKLNVSSVLSGMYLGIPNLLSGVFLVYALSELSAVVVYPVVNSSILILASLLGFFYWNDSFSTKQWSGIAVAGVALFFLL